MSTADMSVEEMTQSLTGFDEIAIQKHMDLDIWGEAEAKPVLTTRALVFIHQTREGKSPADAREHALSMPMRDVLAYFAEDEEAMPDEPVTAAGKDVSLPV